MATNLAGDICLGAHSVCLIRVAALDADCSPIGGADSGFVSLGIASLGVEYEVEEGRSFRPKNGCGRVAWQHEEGDLIVRANLTGELLYHDFEAKRLMFGGTLITGHATRSDFPGEIVGHALPNYNDAPGVAARGVYLEVITLLAGEGVGECTSGVGIPYAMGKIFGKARLTPGGETYEDAEQPVPFTGKATGNPALFDGPWNDYPGTGYIPNSPKVEVVYSRAEYDAIAAVARCGFQTLPAAS